MYINVTIGELYSEWHVMRPGPVSPDRTIPHATSLRGGPGGGGRGRPPPARRGPAHIATNDIYIYGEFCTVFLVCENVLISYHKLQFLGWTES